MDLHTAINDYHALLDEQLAKTTFTQLEAAQRARRLLVGTQRDRLLCAVLRPRFIVPAQLARLEHAATVIGRAIRTIGTAALSDPALLAPYQLTEQERSLLSIDPGYPGAAVFGRLDGFLAADGSTCFFVESNLESPAGIGYDEAVAEIFEQLDVMSAFRQQYQAQALPVRQRLQSLLLETYHAWGGSGTPTVAIVDYRSVVTWAEFEHLQARFTAEGMPTVLADPADLRYDGHRLYAGGTPVDLVYRRVLLHEFLATYDLTHPLIRAYADHAVCVVNPFRTKPVHTKLIMALLSDEDGSAAGLLDAEERAAVRQFIPWSRLVRAGSTRYAGETVNLLQFAREQRERLVLKPNDDYGGAGVMLGWETDPVVWDQALVGALAQPYILQERVPVPEELYPTWTPGQGLRFTPRYVDSDPLIYGNVGMGCLTRIASTSLLNVTAGGGAAPPTFLVQPRT